MTAVGLSQVAYRHVDDFARAAGLTAELFALIGDPDITDVLINPDGSVWVERAGQLHRTGYVIEEVRALAVRLAAAAGRRLDDAAPVVDATIAGRVRLHAILGPLAASGGPGGQHGSPLGVSSPTQADSGVAASGVAGSGVAAISLRVARPQHFSLSELQERAAVAPPVRALIDDLVAMRANTVISGATGSGKTTVLAAALAQVPADQRIVIIEESHELNPPHPHVVRLQSRGANVEGAGGVTMTELVRAALRMRPDRIVLGEARGAEVRDVLTALNTGHQGCWFTVHANSCADVPARLFALASLAGMSEMSLAAQASSALDAIIHISRAGGHRHIAEVAVLQRHGSDLQVVPVVRADPHGHLRTYSAGLDALHRQGLIRASTHTAVGTYAQPAHVGRKP
ncbi:MAG: ATPase, T2SS/T4P/T4SS family [Bowdeniella nasicola]|nr:ATPase, T2SS/T4P/T4SS family [Bowdeniella nasicola]